MTRNWNGVNVVIIGAARQGLALARYLVRKGARVTLTDQRSADQLEGARAALAGLDVRWIVGGHPLSLLEQCDLLCLSGGVPLTLPIVQQAVQKGISLTNDSQLLLEAVPCPVIGITGSAGKTTTTTLVGRMAQSAIQPPRKVWVGGNIGLPLIEYLDEMKPDDLVILELSSFQLELMTISPHIAAILNITPNHLDRHGTMDAYAAAKANILTHQTAADMAILGRDDPGSWNLAPAVTGQLISFGLHRPPQGQVGSFVADGKLWLQTDAATAELMDASIIRLRGEHNLLNVLAACAVAHATGFSAQAMQAGVTDFSGVPHRLEWVRTYHGAEWYNDSIATAPERTTAAIRAFAEPLILLLGGRDKDLPWDELAALVHQRVRHVVVFGEAAPRILLALGEVQPGERLLSITRCDGLYAAVQTASRLCQPGDVVLLSPGGTSFDEFKDFEERGERFREWVNQLS